MKRKSFIPHSLRPYIKGSLISEFVVDEPVESEIPIQENDIVVFSSVDDSTAKYFCSTARSLGIRVGFVSLEGRSGLDSFRACFSRASTVGKPGLYVRSPSSDNPILENYLTYLSDFATIYPGRIIHCANRDVR